MGTTMIPFPEYRPDLHPFDASYTPHLKNVLPRLNGYNPVPDLAAYSSALPGAPKGFFNARQNNLSYQSFAGTQTRLYDLNGTTLAWTDRSKGGLAYTGSVYGWWMTQFGSNVIAVNENDSPQAFNVDTPDTAFSDLAGSPPKAKGCAVIGDFLVLWGVNGNPRRMDWSGINDPEHWVAGKKSSDRQVFPDGGEIKRVVSVPGGGIVFQETRIRLMQFVGGQVVFRFPVIAEDRGALTPGSVVRIQDRIFFLAESGFYQMGLGGDIQPIGEEKVNTTFLADYNTSETDQIQLAADPINNTVWCRYRSNSGAEGTSDKVLVYDWITQRWTPVEVNLTWLDTASQEGYTLESLAAIYPNLENVPFSLDSRVWQGGRPTIAGFDSSYCLSFFSGSNLEATLETGDLRLMQGRRSFVNSWRLVTDASGVKGTVGVKSKHADPITWKGEADLRTSGRFHVRASGLLHRFRARVPAGETWEHIVGIDDIEKEDAGIK